MHLVFAGEKVKNHELFPAPDITQREPAGMFQVVSLAGLVCMKLTAFRDKDRVHLRDLLDVGLIDRSWLSRLPTALAERLQRLIDEPE